MTSRRSVDPEDLVVLARRGCLAEGEVMRLERALASSATLQVARQVGDDCDAEGAVQPGDEALVARVAGGIVGAPPVGRGWRRGRLAGVLAAAVLTGVGAAGAVVWTAVGGGPAREAAAPVPAVSVPPAPVALEPRAGTSSVASSAVASGSAAVAAASVRSAVPPMVDASSLFRQANAARSRGDVARAGALYQELQGRFPGSAEARLSHVSLGKLLLAGGNASAADAQFARYLAGGGALQVEALVGRAECAARMGRVAEERQWWQRVRDRFPGSVYARRAAQRLAELAPDE